MKRLWGTTVAAAIGCAVAFLLGDLGKLNQWPEKPYHGCYEIDACKVPWWILAIFVFWLLGPPLIYGCVGYIGMRREWTPVRWGSTGLALFLGTVSVYLCWYAYRAFF
jgi:hypothetical protein